MRRDVLVTRDSEGMPGLVNLMTLQIPEVRDYLVLADIMHNSPVALHEDAKSLATSGTVASAVLVIPGA